MKMVGHWSCRLEMDLLLALSIRNAWSSNLVLRLIRLGWEHMWTSWYCWHSSTWPCSCCQTSHGHIFLRVSRFCQLSPQVLRFQLMDTCATLQVPVVLYSLACKYWENFNTRCSFILFVGQNKSSRHSHFGESGLPQNRMCYFSWVKHNSKCLFCEPSYLAAMGKCLLDGLSAMRSFSVCPVKDLLL